ncbi:hypothetical protein KIN20_011248 [Parelaphostrongylus tenuis]|uniref:Uncharacterized protein n=1 Tax=Parelaphostrongylus tenuis TaxID=148309 RepID=A0AAD5QPQ7_PARTN|nr:hypothetical protein KIN20_011248 [Parelaphostrongylus tenuis]
MSGFYDDSQAAYRCQVRSSQARIPLDKSRTNPATPEECKAERTSSAGLNHQPRVCRGSPVTTTSYPCVRKWLVREGVGGVERKIDLLWGDDTAAERKAARK